LLRGVSFWLGPVPIGSYRLQYRAGHGEWQTLEQVSDNDQLFIKHDEFELALADTVRLATVDVRILPHVARQQRCLCSLPTEWLCYIIWCSVSSYTRSRCGLKATM
jgi:hypothetical protein